MVKRKLGMIWGGKKIRIHDLFIFQVGRIIRLCKKQLDEDIKLLEKTKTPDETDYVFGDIEDSLHIINSLIQTEEYEPKYLGLKKSFTIGDYELFKTLSKIVDRMEFPQPLGMLYEAIKRNPIVKTKKVKK